MSVFTHRTPAERVRFVVILSMVFTLTYIVFAGGFGKAKEYEEPVWITTTK